MEATRVGPVEDLGSYDAAPDDLARGDMDSDRSTPKSAADPDHGSMRPTVWVGVASALVAAVGALLASMQGPGLAPDSLSYLSSALSLESGEGLRTFAGMPLTMFPPGLPVLLAGVIRLGGDPELFLGLLNALSAGVVVTVVAALLRRHVASVPVVIGATIWTGVSVALLDVSKMALSECTFLAVSSLFLWVLQRWTDRHDTAGRLDVPCLAALIVLAWTAIALRYAGLALVPIGALSIVVIGRRELRRAVTSALVFCIGAAVAPALIVWRNLDADGTTMGPRSASPDGLPETVLRYIAVLGEWWVPDPTPVALQGLVGAAFVAGVVLALWWIARRTTAVSSGRGALAAELQPLAPLLLFVAIYSGYLVLAQLRVAFDPIDSRLMSPLLTPAVVLTAVLVDRLLGVVDGRSVLRRVVTGAAVALVVVQGATFSLDVVESARDGVGYAERSWQDSELVATAAALPATAQLYANTPAGVWAALRRPVEQAPAKEGRRSGVPIEMSDDFVAAASCEDAYLIWSDSSASPHLFSPDELGEFVELSVVDELGDGTIYRLSARDGSDAATC